MNPMPLMSVGLCSQSQASVLELLSLLTCGDRMDTPLPGRNILLTAGGGRRVEGQKLAAARSRLVLSVGGRGAPGVLLSRERAGTPPNF